MRVLAKSVKVTVFAAFAAMMLMFGLVSPAFAADTEMDNPVLDSAGMFTPEQASQLQYALHDADDTYGLVYVVETISALDGRDISSLAAERANSLGVGDAEKNNGVYMLIAKDDRKVWVTVGSGVQDKVTNSDIQNTIDQVVIPGFKQGDYLSAVIQGVKRIGEVYTGSYTEPVPAPVDLTWLGVTVLVILGLGVAGILIWVIVLIVKARRDRAERLARQKEADEARAIREERDRVERFYNTVRINSTANSETRAKLQEAKTTEERKQFVQEAVKAVPDEYKDLIPSFSMAVFEKNYLNMIRADEIRKGGLRMNSSTRSLNTSEWNELRGRTFAEFEAELRSEIIKLGKEEERVRREQARAEKKRQEKEAKQKQEAKGFWSQLTAEQKRSIKAARTNSEKQRIMNSYNNTGTDTNILFPLLVGMYISEIGRPESSYTSHSSYGSSSSSSHSSYDSGSSFGSDFSSFGGGGGFSDGGGGSW